MKRLKMILGLVALFVVVFALSNHVMTPAPTPALLPPPAELPAARKITIDRIPQEMLEPDDAQKKDALRRAYVAPTPEVTTDPKPVFTDRILVPPPPEATSKQLPVSDICTRHKMHKVMTRGGRSWHCRR
jgi:hypothetical protein